MGGGGPVAPVAPAAPAAPVVVLTVPVTPATLLTGIPEEAIPFGPAAKNAFSCTTCAFAFAVTVSANPPGTKKESDGPIARLILLSPSSSLRITFPVTEPQATSKTAARGTGKNCSDTLGTGLPRIVLPLRTIPALASVSSPQITNAGPAFAPTVSNSFRLTSTVLG